MCLLAREASRRGAHAGRAHRERDITNSSKVRPCQDDVICLPRPDPHRTARRWQDDHVIDTHRKSPERVAAEAARRLDDGQLSV